MSVRARVGAVVGSSLVVGLLALLTGTGRAEDEKDLGATIQKIADLIAKGDQSTAAQQAKALAKDTELEDVMHLLKPRKKKGLGVGKTPNRVTPDGIEQQYLKLARDELSQAALNQEAGALQQMGYHTAAVADFALAKPPEKDQGGDKTTKKWGELARDMRANSLAFVKALKTKSPSEVHKAAEKVNNTCTSCHMVFRD